MSILFRLFIFLLPTQLGYHFWPEWSYVFGIRVDYLSPTIFLTDLLLAGLLGLFALKALKDKELFSRKFFLGVLLFLGLATLNVALSLSPPLAVFKWIKFLELFSLALLVAKTKEFDFKNWVAIPLGLSIIFFSLIGLAQVWLGRTLGGLLYFLGERSFNLSTPGISLAHFFGKGVLRAYSTFSHPNSLAGFLGVGILMMALSGPREGKGRLIKMLALLSGGVCLLATFSSAAMLALIVVLLTRVIKKRKELFRVACFSLFGITVFGSLLLPVAARSLVKNISADNESLYKRLTLAEAAGRIISEKPLFGVGAGGFIVQLPNKGAYPSTAWWLQPVHNIYLLVFSETGMVGLLVFVYVLFAALSRNVSAGNNLVFPLLFILLTGSLDHYWLTLTQNQLLASIVLGLSFRRVKV